jgi:probable HAF family extracellular repeat protein
MNLPPRCSQKTIRPAVCKVLIVALLALLHSGTAQAIQPPPQYQLVILPPPSGSLNSHAEDVNNVGMVTGRTWAGSQDSNPQSVFWNTNGTPTVIPIGQSAVYAVNDAGHAAGNLSGGGSFGHAYFYDGATAQDIHTSTLNAIGSFSIALDLNNANQVVGWVSPSAGGAQSAYAWQNGTTILLGTLGGNESVAFAINNQGQISGRAETSNHNDRAFIWKDLNGNNSSEAGEMVQLADMGLSSTANAINDLGVAAGFVLTPAFKRQAAIWNTPSSFTPLPNLLGKTEAECFDISMNGDVVGTTQGTAVLWRAGQAYDLNQLIPAGSGLNLLVASGINDQGWIAGMGLQGNFERGFLLIPVPEPSASFLALVASSILLRRSPFRRERLTPPQPPATTAPPAHVSATPATA